MTSLASNLHPRQRRATVAEIDLAILRENFQAFRKHLPANGFLCPMVKANAYGHGDVEVAKSLRIVGAQHLGVALIEEGERLRQNGDQKSVLVFAGFDREGAQALRESKLTPVANDFSQLSHLENAWKGAAEKSTGLHIEFNTGMNRLGFEVKDAARVRAWLEKNPQFVLEGVCTHLYHGSDAGAQDGESDRQLRGLAEAVAAFHGFSFQVHALNSVAASNIWQRQAAALGLTPEAKSTLGVRPGIGLYGADPETDDNGHLDVRPFMTWKTKLMALHQIEVGEAVSYDAIWRAKRPSLIGVLPVGYADGYSRQFSNRSAVLCQGERAPIAGKVCMDYFMVDLTDVKTKTGTAPQIGDEVVLLGKQGRETISVQELAKLASTITYEIFTSVSARVPRKYLNA